MCTKGKEKSFPNVLQKTMYSVKVKKLSVEESIVPSWKKSAAFRNCSEPLEKRNNEPSGSFEDIM
jgi:hypothetical protein